jgi:hypothetical protein
MKVSEPSEVETSSAAAESARAEAASWSEKRVAMERSAAELAAKIATVTGETAADRLAAIRAGTGAPTALLDKRRKLQDEAEEEAARIVVARAEEVRTQAIYRTAARAADIAKLLADATVAAEQAAATELDIDRTFGELCALLQARSDLEDGLQAVLKMIAIQNEAAATTGDPLIGGVPGGRFAWGRLSHANDRHGRYSLPGGA